MPRRRRPFRLARSSFSSGSRVGRVAGDRQPAPHAPRPRPKSASDICQMARTFVKCPARPGHFSNSLPGSDNVWIGILLIFFYIYQDIYIYDIDLRPIFSAKFLDSKSFWIQRATPSFFWRPAIPPGSPHFGAPRPERPSDPANPGLVLMCLHLLEYPEWRPPGGCLVTAPRGVVRALLRAVPSRSSPLVRLASLCCSPSYCANWESNRWLNPD